MRVAMRQRAADRRHVAHPHIGQPLHDARDDRRVAGDFRRVFDHGERRERADAQSIAIGCDAAEAAVKLAQTDEPARLEHAGLHHQHQRGAAGDRPHGRIVRIDGGDGVFQRRRLDQFERRHGAASALPPAKAACRFLLNCFSISRALARSTGSPIEPSLPVMVASMT